MSFSPETEKLVNELIQAEYLNAVVNFGEKYHSLHEGYAVLKEEIEEVKELLEPFDNDFCRFWTYIKANHSETTKKYANGLIIGVEEIIKELAQVGAVLMKIKNTLEDK